MIPPGPGPFFEFELARFPRHRLQRAWIPHSGRQGIPTFPLRILALPDMLAWVVHTHFPTPMPA